MLKNNQIFNIRSFNYDLNHSYLKSLKLEKRKIFMILSLKALCSVHTPEINIMPQVNFSSIKHFFIKAELQLNSNQDSLKYIYIIYMKLVIVFNHRHY